MGYKFKDIPYEMKVGRDIKCVANLMQTIKDQESMFDFILVNICHSNNFKTPETILSRDIALTRPGNLSFTHFQLFTQLYSA